MAVKLRATRPSAQLAVDEVSCLPGHKTPAPLERSPPGRFKRMLGGLPATVLPRGATQHNGRSEAHQGHDPPSKCGSGVCHVLGRKRELDGHRHANKTVKGSQEGEM